MPSSKCMDSFAGEETIEIEELNDVPESMRAFFPASFGKQTETRSRSVGATFERTKRAESEKPSLVSKGKQKVATEPERKRDENEDEDKSDSRSDEDNEVDDEDSDSDGDDSQHEDEFPISHELVIKQHTRAVTSISLDPTGTRFATASYDYSMKLFDFPSMNPETRHPFRSVEATDSHHVHSATFSHLDKGQHILVIPAATQAKILSRDGDTVVEFVKGDMYLRDMHNTKGHVSEITAGCWHPTSRDLIATAGTDSTVRIWDINDKRKQRDVIVHRSRTAKGGRSRMCCISWSPGEGEKSMLGSVAMDGTLLIWDGQGPFNRPNMEVASAHKRETWTSSLCFSQDGRLLVTKGGPGDDSIKLWDTRKLKTPVTVRQFMPPPQQETNIIFSPTSSNILTGDASGNIHLLSPATLASEKVVPIAPNNPLVTVTWHKEINHILTGDSSGTVHILYSPTLSTRGAKFVVTKAPKKRHIDDDPSFTTDPNTLSDAAIILPNAILDRPKTGHKKGGTTDRFKPHMPTPTPWGKSNPDQQYLKRNVSLVGMRDEDPREALLRYAEIAESDPMFTKAWSKTQPKPIYANIEDDGEEENQGREAKKIKK